MKIHLFSMLLFPLGFIEIASMVNVFYNSFEFMEQK